MLRIPLPKKIEKTIEEKTKYNRPDKKQELKKIIQDVSMELKKKSSVDLYRAAVRLASEKLKSFDESEYDTGGFDIMKQVVKHPKPVKKSEIKLSSLTHNSTLNDKEPTWSDVDKTSLPRNAFAEQGEEGKKSSWKYPHHYIVGGTKNDDGIYESGDMFLHKGGLNAAWAAANGARSGQKASHAVISHLQEHKKALEK